MPKAGTSANKKGGNPKAGELMAFSKMAPGSKGGGSKKTTVGIIKNPKAGK